MRRPSGTLAARALLIGRRPACSAGADGKAGCTEIVSVLSTVFPVLITPHMPPTFTTIPPPITWRAHRAVACV